jgi:hypothetical protein
MKLDTLRGSILLVGLGLLVAGCDAATQVPGAACRSISTMRNQSILLDESATYCLQTDIWIDDAGVFVSHGRDRPYFAIQILNSDVNLDMQGHTAHSGDSTNGVVIQNKTPSDAVPRHVTISNGKIDSITWGISSGFSNMLIASDLGDPLESVASTEGKSEAKLSELRDHIRQLELSSLAKQNALRPRSPAAYLERDVHLENLHFIVRGLSKGTGAGGGAVSIQGAGTVIRNCVIETDDGNAIWIFGPNAVIENNTIIVHGKNRLREADAPIRLIQADGAVIRGNKFVIRDKANRRGISTFETGPISVEDNIFFGMSKGDEVARAFLGELHMNESGSKFEPVWKALFSADR